MPKCSCSEAGLIRNDPTFHRRGAAEDAVAPHQRLQAVPAEHRPPAHAQGFQGPRAGASGVRRSDRCQGSGAHHQHRGRRYGFALFFINVAGASIDGLVAAAMLWCLEDISDRSAHHVLKSGLSTSTRCCLVASLPAVHMADARSTAVHSPGGLCKTARPGHCHLLRLVRATPPTNCSGRRCPGTVPSSRLVPPSCIAPQLDSSRKCRQPEVGTP